MKKVLVVLVIVAAGVALWFGCQKKAMDTPAVEEMTEEMVDTEMPAPPPDQPADEESN